MPAHSDDERRLKAAQAKPAATRPASSATDIPHGIAAVASLQRLVGNHAVAGVLQREEGQGYLPPPTTGLGRPRPGASTNGLHLDPAIEAQIRAIEAMRTKLVPEQASSNW